MLLLYSFFSGLQKSITMIILWIKNYNFDYLQSTLKVIASWTLCCKTRLNAWQAKIPPSSLKLALNLSTFRVDLPPKSLFTVTSNELASITPSRHHVISELGFELSLSQINLTLLPALGFSGLIVILTLEGGTKFWKKKKKKKNRNWLQTKDSDSTLGLLTMNS